MRKIAFIAGCLAATSAHAQSTGIPWVNGRILTAPMLQSLDQAKMNINSLGKPGFAPQLNALGQITNPVVGDVSQAKATADGQTVVEVTAKAANAVQKSDVGAASGVAPLDASKMMSAPVSGDVSGAKINSQTVADVINGLVPKSEANLPNGYAKLDANKTVTVPVTGSVAAAPANSTGDTVSSIADKANNAIPTTSGKAIGLVLTGAQVPQFPADVPGKAGTGLPNTLWVDKYYAPKGWFIASNTTWTVCASGCLYSNPLDAWHAAIGANFINGAVLTVSIANGTYNLNDQFFTNVTKTQYVHVIGNTTDPSKVILNFTNTKGTNLGGFSAYRGGKIGLIDGVTIQAPTDGTGSKASTDSLGRHIWNSQSYGGGVQAYGSGSSITLGSHVVIRGFYYSLVADNNGGIDAPQGGVSMSIAGDVNAMARGGGVIVCTPCSATDASDYTNPSIQLGSNYDAERGGSLYIDGSTGSKSLVNGIVGLTGGHIWAHNTVFSGSLISGQGSGAWVTGNSSVEFTGAKFSGYLNGVLAQSGGVAFIDSCTITANTNGVVADGGHVNGGSTIIKNNTGIGIQALHQGTVLMFGTYTSMSGNGTNFSVQSAGTQSVSRTTYAASSIDVQ